MVRRNVVHPSITAVFLALAAFTLADALLALAWTRAPFDIALTRGWQRLDPEPLEPLMYALNDQWNIARIAVVALVLGYGLANRRAIVLFLLLPIAAGSLNPLLKHVFDRPRPTADLVNITEHAAGGGYPSGHVMNAVLLFGFLFVLSGDLIANGTLRWVVRVACVAVVALMGPARVYSGAHWPSDVLGGYLFGALILLAVVQIYRRATVHWSRTDAAR